MTKHLRFLFVVLLAMIWSAGWAQEVTMNFTDNTSWNFPTDSKNTKSGTYGKGNCAVSLTGGNYYSTTNKYLMLKKKGTLTFATFNFDVEKIVITGKKGASSSTKQNIYVGNVAVSSETIGSEATNTYLIKDGYQSAGNRYVLKVFDANAQITKIQIYKKGASSSTKTDTKVSFGENTGKTFTFTEGKYSDDTFTTPTATETNGVAGTVAYSSSNATAISVNSSTGELSFPGYGEATITATFTPTDTETYAGSTDCYTVKNLRGVVAGTITFDKANGAFEGLSSSDYDANGIGNFSFISDSKESFTFDCTRVLKSDGCIQLKKTSRTEINKIVSPTFPNFANGYKVNIIYSSKKGLKLSAGGKDIVGSTTATNEDKGLGANVSISVPANASFVMTSGSEVVYISKIEIIPNKVDETTTITLNENSESNNIVAKTGVNVTLKRTMVANEWNTICLPFDVTWDKIKTVFGEGVKVAQLDNTNSTGTTLKFVDMTDYGMLAAEPYLIKPVEASPADGYKFDGVEIKETAVNPAHVKTAGGLYFNGIYNMVDITTDVASDYYAAFLGAGNKIYKANGSGNKTKGFRAYFAIPNGAAASALRVVIDGTATSIKNIDSEVVESNAPVYNLQGQRVNGNNLTPGIYVKAGKKFVVK